MGMRSQYLRHLVILKVAILIVLGGAESLIAGQFAFMEAEVARQLGEDVCCETIFAEPEEEFMDRIDRFWSHEGDIVLDWFGTPFLGWQPVRAEYEDLLHTLGGIKGNHYDRMITISGDEASLFHNCTYGGGSYHCYYRLRKENGHWRIYYYRAGSGGLATIGQGETLAPDDENELRNAVRKVIKPGLEKKDFALLESINAEGIAFINSRGERIRGWSLAKPALSAELDALKPKLREVTIYLDLDGGEAFVFDEDDTDLGTSFRLSKIGDSWKLTLIDFTGQHTFNVEPNGKSATTWGKIKGQHYQKWDQNCLIECGCLVFP